jgi:hypothetical protein
MPLTTVSLLFRFANGISCSVSAKLAPVADGVQRLGATPLAQNQVPYTRRSGSPAA